MRISDLKITKEQFTNVGPIILVDVREVFAYKDGERTDHLQGFKYHVIAPKRKYDSAYVRVDGLTPIITNEELEESDTPVIVDFEGFEGRFYKYNNDYAFTAKATAIKIVSGNGKVGK